MRKIKITTVSSITAVAILVVMAASLLHTASGLLQGSDGTTPDSPPLGFTFEPFSFLIGLGGGAIALGIPLLARAASHKAKGKIRGNEQCDDGNPRIDARSGGKGRGVKSIKDMGNSGREVAGNPIGGLTIKAGGNKPPGITDNTKEGGTEQPAPGGPFPESTDASKLVPGIGIIVKKCPDPSNPRCATSVK